MARQLVLVPKVKYEYLLKKAGEDDNTIQRGKGKAEESKISDVQGEEKTDDKESFTNSTTDHSHESTGIRPSNREPIEDSNLDTSRDAKMFVEAPLTKMGFIDNTKRKIKPRKETLKPHVPRRVTGSKSATKMKWINYTV